MQVAVTGGAGFIGKALLKALADAGVEVRALENRTAVLTHKNITPIKGSLTDTAALQELVKGCDAVVHAAGLVAARKGRAFYDVNTEGTRRVAQIAAYENCPRFLLVSSLSAREEGLSHYGHSKKRAEVALTEIPGLGWDVIRPPAVYGPEDMQFLALMKMIKSGRVFLPAGHKARASVIYVDDLVAAVKAWVLSGEAKQKVYEIDDGKAEGYLWQDVIGFAAQAIGTKPKVVVPPKPALHALSYASWFSGFFTSKPPLLPPEKMRQLCHRDWVCRDSGFMVDFAWQPEVNAKEGFAKTIKWYQRQSLL